MMDKDQIAGVLASAFPDATEDVIRGAADRLASLDEEWEEVTSKEEQLGYHYCAGCIDICYLADQVERGRTFRLFRKRREPKW